MARNCVRSVLRMLCRCRVLAPVYGSQSVPQGQWLALRFTNTHSPASKTIDISTAGGSYVISPSSDPGYPVPDVGAILMFAAGLIVVGWFVRKQKKGMNLEGAAA